MTPLRVGREAPRGLRGFPLFQPRVHPPGHQASRRRKTACNRASSCRLFPIPYSLFPAVPHSTAPKASAALIPPNPKLLLTIRRTGISAPSPVT
jgi:hypothetical protein